MSDGLSVVPVAGLPEVAPGDDLAALLAERVDTRPGDVLVVAHKVVSKAEGQVVDLAGIEPSARALELTATFGPGKDPRQVEVVLRQSTEVIRARAGVLITRTHHGFVCANAGVDASNAGAADRLVLLPVDPDASARALRASLPGRPAVVVSDSFGRAWRVGQADVAIGVAGLAPLVDWRGRPDADGRAMRATWIAVADLVASAGDLVRAKDGRVPAALVRGLGEHVTDDDGPGAQALLRPPAEDLFL